jgi:sugar phosphate isomerase/epimerase
MQCAARGIIPPDHGLIELDYKRIIQILKNVNYQGYISIEFEGKEAASTGVRKSVELLRKALAS